jgi:hypothetical protein
MSTTPAPVPNTPFGIFTAGNSAITGTWRA